MAKEDEIDHKLENITGIHKDEVEKIKHLDLTQFAAASKSKFDTIKKNLDENLKHLSHQDAGKRDEIITHVGTAIQDVYELERKPRLSGEQVNQKIAKIAPKISGVHRDIINNKSFFKENFEKLIGEIVDLAGPNRDITGLVLSVDYSSEKYITSHTLNVVLLSISIAIELSKIMEKKLADPTIANDFKRIIICNQKIFTRKELIDLGISALLHDLNISENFPELKKDTIFDFRQESKIERHAAATYHFLKANFPELDFEIKKTIYQHHEFIDGSGHPNGDHGRRFTKYSIVLSYAVYFIMNTTENPFNPLKHPHVFLQHIMSNLRDKFDDDVLLAHVKGSGIYPLGSWVLLNSGEIAIVIINNPKNLKEPSVRVLLDKNFTQVTCRDVNTASDKIKILSPVPYLEIKKRIPEYRKLLFSGSTYRSPFIPVDENPSQRQ